MYFKLAEEVFPIKLWEREVYINKYKPVFQLKWSSYLFRP